MTNSDIRTARREAAIQNLLVAAREGTEVYNVDFNDWKDMAGRVYEGTVSAKLRSPFFHCGEYENRTDAERAIEDAVGFGLHTFPSKKLLTLIERADETPMVSAVIELITEFQPIRDAIKTLKPNVIKGRKPSTNPNKTPARTIENTGTCAICGQNVKLSGGKIVAHGYTIRYGWQQGNCFGVRYAPIETSNEALVAYVSMLNGVIDQTMTTLAAMKNDIVEVYYDRRNNKIERDNERFEQFRAVTISRTESDLRAARSALEHTNRSIAAWEAKPLPGAK